MNMIDINFIQNWNGGKLNNACFPVLKPHNPGLFKKGRYYRILLKGTPLKETMCTQMQTIKLEELTEYHAGLDMGYDKATTLKIIRKLYSKMPEKCQDDSLFDFMLMKTTKTY